MIAFHVTLGLLSAAIAYASIRMGFDGQLIMTAIVSTAINVGALAYHLVSRRT